MVFIHLCSNPAADSARPTVSTGGVGKYLQAKQLTNVPTTSVLADGAAAPQPAKKAKKAAYGNFDAW